MDVFSNASAWLQHSPTQISQSSQNDLADTQRPPSSTDWKDPSPSVSGSNGAPAVSGNIDLHDFGLGDLSAPQTSSTSPSTFFNYPNNFFLPSVSTPYNAMNYGPTNWSPQPGQVPLSTYSTLNGATSSTSQSPSSQSSQPNIDPALTTLSTSTPPLSYSPPANGSQQQSSQHHLLHSQYPHLSSLSIAYAQVLFFPFGDYPRSSAKPNAVTSAVPTTRVLRKARFLLLPSTPLSTCPPFRRPYFTAQHPSPIPLHPHPTPAERRFSRLSSPHFSLKSFAGGARSVQQLVSRIIEYGISEVSGQTRLDILTKIRDNAGNNYFRAWLENISAMDVTRDWLKAGATINTDNQVLETVMPLLHIADRLPFTGDTLVSSKIGKIVRKLAKDAPIPAVKDMAANLERKWRNQFVYMQDQVMAAEDDIDAKQKKRKLPDAPSKAGPPTKKSAVSPASTSRPSVVVKKEGRLSTPTAAGAATVKDSKSDSSFFSAPKQKPKLPSFKKAPTGPTASTAVKKETIANVAQPSSTDAFQEALKGHGESAETITGRT
ncbi:hypothetical protein EDB83DRAFT_2522756 [Lactarius deliciosus]|nr:hypothetical protein EDB83DRAFT_2522756 [Lactarius deliciosus]